MKTLYIGMALKNAHEKGDRLKDFYKVCRLSCSKELSNASLKKYMQFTDLAEKYPVLACIDSSYAGATQFSKELQSQLEKMPFLMTHNTSFCEQCTRWKADPVSI